MNQCELCSKAVLVWKWHEAPEPFQILTAGGDEDYVVAAPPGVDVPYKLTQLGCCDNNEFRVARNGDVEERRERDDGETLAETGQVAFDFPGWRFWVSSTS